MTHAKRCMLDACNLLPSCSPSRSPRRRRPRTPLMSLMMALGRRMRQRQPGDVIDYSAFPLLKLLSHQGPMRVSAMAHVLGLDASTVSRHAKQLEDRGLLERTEDPDDGRASRVTVSEQGNACLAQAFETRRHVISTALDGFSDDERETLRDAARPARADPARPPATPAPTPTTPRSTPHDPRLQRLPQPQADPRGDGRPDGGHVPLRSRPEHRGNRPPPHHLRPRRPRQAVVGRHGVHARRHRLHPAVGQDLRPLRPQAALPDRDHHLPGRLAARRLVAQHRGADRLPRDPGPRWRRPDGAGHGHHRRRDPAA